MIPKGLFIIDAETDGLYGSFLSVAVLITDSNYNILREEYYGIKKANLHIQNEWVKTNVVPIMGEYEECADEQELLDKVWDLWIAYKDQVQAIADVVYPVEVRLFQKCVDMHPEERYFQGPYPLLDLSSLLYAKGYDPLVERKTLLKEPEIVKQHNALDDVRMTLEIYKELMI